jgi:hypothetical protein
VSTTSPRPSSRSPSASAERSARIGLPEHVARVRTYYAALRAGRPSDAWSHEMNVEWMRLLRAPPYENDYPVRPRMSDCPACDLSRKYTVAVFPGGSKHQCACGVQWLELDA